MKSSVDRDNNYCHYVITSFYEKPASQLRYIIIRQDVIAIIVKVATGFVYYAAMKTTMLVDFKFHTSTNFYEAMQS
jgi:hypothetical protein